MQAFIRKWQHTPGGAERANYGVFLQTFCGVLGLEAPSDPAVGGVLGRYQFDGPVAEGSLNGGPGFIDFYRKGSFVLEAKQSKIPPVSKTQPEMFDPDEVAPKASSGAKYDLLMRRALRQAKSYVHHLPSDHPWPPFIIVCDVGRAFELYFDYSGNGRGYDFYPDRQGYRITIEQLADPDVQALFRDIWERPKARDPRLRAAEVTREVAKRLADVSKWLEATQRQRTSGLSNYEKSLAIEETSLFLMRILFCMFAEDVGLLPRDSFKRFLQEAVEVENDQHFQTGLRDLWRIMGSDDAQPRWSWALKGEVRYFNGGLFDDAKTFVLGEGDKGELLAAARADWKRVEPAIFGTLLEQALTPSERSKLGAHYTPRPYVERLVRATIMDVLEAEWEAVQAEVEALNATDSDAAALEAVRAFHKRLSGLRILDPACGTGNFLYISMELLLRLEADVLVLIEQLGGEAEPEVGPQQFLGLELNPRAAVIAELVLWIGWLRWRMSNDPEEVPEPVLRRTATINFGGHAGYDAVLTHKPTGEPDLDNPMVPDWPEADFIVGNPPFIGGKDIRARLGGDYAEALWKANPRVPKSADFVMQWWDRAANILTSPNSALVRFGFVTTNSITQEFSRRVIAAYIEVGKASLLMALPDHPWTKAAKEAAAVRIAMTVAGRGEADGTLVEVLKEEGLDSDDPQIATAEVRGAIHANLTTGADVGSTAALRANAGLCSPGVKLHGAGFIVTPKEAAYLGLGRREGLEAFIRPYRNGRDLMQSPRGAMVIDLFGQDERDVRKRYPEVYQHLMETVKVARDAQVAKSPTQDAKAYAEQWWAHGKPRTELRPALVGLARYIVTVETAKHRVFQFLPADVLPDNRLVVVADERGETLGVLQSKAHLAWTSATGGTLEDRPVYTKSACFDPFPFPTMTAASAAETRELAEELDETRKLAIAEVDGLTMTELYNLRDAVRRGDSMDLVQQARAQASRARIIDQLHDKLDAAVAAAYGWPADLPPSEIITRLVALNAECAAEEKEGQVRWLRPDYQRPRFGADKA
ncbi:class I SAM-dependent DNA methyltransferase [Tsuneonella sp. HG249]